VRQQLKMGKTRNCDCYQLSKYEFEDATADYT